MQYFLNAYLYIRNWAVKPDTQYENSLNFNLDINIDQNWIAKRKKLTTG